MARGYKAYPEYQSTTHRWLGDVPANWEIFDGKRLFENRREASRDTDEQLAASQKFGVVPQSLMMELNDAKVMLALKGTSSFRHVEQDDFVISLRSFEGGIEHSYYVGCVSPAYTVLAAKMDVEPRFYRYLFKSRPFITALQSTTDSLRDGKSITYEQFGSIPSILPGKSEQQKIADFLDYETAKIDSLIEKQQQLIELLKEKRQAVISHAVTKGLNPDTPMRDSEVEWLGEVPEHWRVTKTKYLFQFVTSGSRGWAEYYADEGSIFFRIANLTRDTIEPKMDSIQYVNPPLGSEGVRAKVRSDDILISITADLGSVCVADASVEGGYVSQHVALCRPNTKVASSRWLGYFVVSDAAKDQLLGAGYGGTKVQLSLEDIRELWVVMPEANEQVKIGRYLDGQLKKFAEIITMAEAEVSLLRERQSALISAAVTGKIDVRDWQQPENSTKEAA